MTEAVPVPASRAASAAPADLLGHYDLISDMLDSLRIGLCLFDAEDRALLWNRSFLRLFPEHEGQVWVGEPYAENLRRFYASRLGPDELGSIDQCIAEGIVRHRTQTDPYIFEHRGQWVRVVARPVPGIGRMRLWTPIACPTGAEAFRTAADEDPLRAVMPFVADGGDGVTLLDAAGRIAWANDRFARFFGLARAEQAIGRTHAEIYTAALRGASGQDGAAGPWPQTLADAERFTGTPFELPLPRGGWLRVLQQRMDGNTVVSTFADISAMKELQRELCEAREVAERASRAKDEFLATVSHELRTPMNGILGMLDILDDGRLGPDQAGWLGVARQSAEALLGLLDNLLAFTRLEAGHVAADRMAERPAGLLDAVVRLMQPRAAEKGLALRWSLDPGVPDRVICDPARLRQVLLNLIGNAVKFTERGSVGVTARRGAALPDDGFLLEIAVEDTGIGVPADALDAIFLPFVQADSGISRRYGGTGLGLAICRQLVRAMGGEITVTSTEGQGSCFGFSVACGPADGAEAPARPTAEAVRLPPLRVLVVDDHAINRDVARLHLQRLDMDVVTVPGGAEALAACAGRFDLILMDLEMPGMDGFEAARAIRESGLPGAGAPILALTAHVGEAHRGRCREAGMQGFVPKPIRVEALATEMARVIGLCPGGGEMVPPAPAPAGSPAVEGLLDTVRLQALKQQIPAGTWAALMQEFEEHARGAVDAITAAAERGEACREAAHGLKGTAWNLGAQRLGDLADALDRLGAGERRPRLPELRQVLEATLVAMHGLSSARRPVPQKA